MAGERPQFHTNKLKPIPLNSLSSKVPVLQSYIDKALQILDEKVPLPNNSTIRRGQDDGDDGTQNVICLLHIYLWHRNKDFITKEQRDSYSASALKRLLTYPPSSTALNPRKLSPLNNNRILGEFMYIAIACLLHGEGWTSSDVIDRSVASLTDVVYFAMGTRDVAKINFKEPLSSGPVSGTDEVLQGRAGLLWGILLLRDMANTVQATTLQPLFDLVPALVERIVASGMRGWNTFMTTSTSTTEPAEALLWPWLDSYYGFGAMHGATGILAVLLSCPESEPHHARIAATITYIARTCIKEGGHLPMSVPDFPSKRPRTQPLVQLCHGATGFALTLAFARRNQSFLNKYGRHEWSEAQKLAHAVTWREGLLSKGLGVCHGVAGTALPWILAVSTSPKMMEGATAMLLDIADAPPMGTDERFREPDKPYDLLEGLAGTVMVWNEAIRVINDLGDGKGQK